MDLTPIFRIEHFLDAIINNTTPPEPIHRVEFYLAQIAGADVEIPEPIFRIEKYLAKICGEDVEIPDPVFRIEFWLAKKCGMDVETPTPVFRIEFWLEEWAGGSAPTYETLTGKIISFIAKRIDAIKSLSLAIEPVQSGTGDPSPDNVRPISGHTGATVYDDPKYGGTIVWNQMFDGTGERTTDGITTNYNETTKQIQITNNSRTSNYSSGSTRAGVVDSTELISGHKYLQMFSPEVTGVVLVYNNSTTPLANIFTHNTATWIALQVTKEYDFVTAHPVGDVTKVQLNIFDLTEMFGEGNEPSTVEEFKALFPHDYYDPSEPTETIVSAVNGDPYGEVTLTFGSTVYGGTATDNGDGSWTVVADRAAYDLGDVTWTRYKTGNNYIFYGDILDGKKHSGATETVFLMCTCYKPVLRTTGASDIGSGDDCSIGVNNTAAVNGTRLLVKDAQYETAASFTSAVSGQKVVYELAAPITFTVTAEHLTALVGNNNVWASTNGDITATVQTN